MTSSSKTIEPSSTLCSARMASRSDTSRTEPPSMKAFNSSSPESPAGAGSSLYTRLRSSRLIGLLTSLLLVGSLSLVNFVGRGKGGPDAEDCRDLTRIRLRPFNPIAGRPIGCELNVVSSTISRRDV